MIQDLYSPTRSLNFRQKQVKVMQNQELKNKYVMLERNKLYQK